MSFLFLVNPCQQLLDRCQKIALSLHSGSNVFHERAPACNVCMCIAVLWLIYAILGRFERRIFGTECPEPFFEDKEGFFGINTQDFIFQNEVRTNRHENMPLIFKGAFRKPFAGVAGKNKGLLGNFSPLLNPVLYISQLLFKAHLLSQQPGLLEAIFLVTQEAAIHIGWRELG